MVRDMNGRGDNYELVYDFVERVVVDINERFPGQVFAFTMDNLNAHKNPFGDGVNNR